MIERFKVILICFSMLLISCSEEAPVEVSSDAVNADTKSEAPEAKNKPEEVGEGAPSEEEAPGDEVKLPPSNVVDDSPIPTEAECKNALISMTNFAEKIGQKPPKKKERKEFLAQCEHWPRKNVLCLVDATEPAAVLECIKPITKLEMKRNIEEAKKTVPGAGSRGGKKMLAPKKVKDRGGAAARRMESFKKAVGKD